MRHADPRVYIGPRTNEIIVALGRAYNTDLIKDHPMVTMTVYRNDYQEDWISYGVSQDGYAHFHISDEFMECGPAGFYRASMCIADCEVARIEIIKAPSYYAKGASSTTTDCKVTKWIEPCCTKEEKEECGCDCQGELTVGCHCGFYFRDECPSCSKTYITVKVESRSGYGVTGLNTYDTAKSPIEGD